MLVNMNVAYVSMLHCERVGVFIFTYIDSD